MDGETPPTADAPLGGAGRERPGDGRTWLRAAWPALLAGAIEALVVGVVSFLGWRLLAEYDQMVAETGQGTNGPIAGLLILFLADILLAGAGGLVIGAIAAVRSPRPLRGLGIGAAASTLPALGALATVLVAQALWPILLHPPGTVGRTTNENAGLATLIATLIGMIVAWGIGSFVRFVGNLDRRYDDRSAAKVTQARVAPGAITADPGTTPHRPDANGPQRPPNP